MAQILRLASTRTLLACKTTRVKFIVLPRIPRRLPRPNLNNHHTLLGTMLWIRALPWTTTWTILMTLNQPLVGPKSTLISQNTSRGPDFYPHLQRRISPLNIGIGPLGSQKSYSDQDHSQHDPDSPYYREVALSDIPSQYAEEVDTFQRILKLPDPRESLPRSSTAVMGLDDEKGRQELRPRGPSSKLPLNSVIKDAFDKFDQDFQAANLPESKYIKPPPSTAKWYKVGQPCYEDKI